MTIRFWAFLHMMKCLDLFFLSYETSYYGFRVPRNGNPFGNLLLHVLEHAEVFRHIFSFMLRQVTMGSRVPRNGNPDRVLKNEESYSKSLRIEI